MLRNDVVAVPDVELVRNTVPWKWRARVDRIAPFRVVERYAESRKFRGGDVRSSADTVQRPFLRVSRGIREATGLVIMPRDRGPSDAVSRSILYVPFSRTFLYPSLPQRTRDTTCCFRWKNRPSESSPAPRISLQRPDPRFRTSRCRRMFQFRPRTTGRRPWRESYPLKIGVSRPHDPAVHGTGDRP